jgi:protein farnesyltransferase subunit beta
MLTMKSHLATTYGALLSITLVGGDTNFQLIDRTAMWQWLGRLKKESGGFQISEGAEEDTRGTYCALVILSLLNLPMELPHDAPSRAAGFMTFNDGVGEYISRCQTYEGGISGTPGNEAHGAYVFCALGTLCLLGEPKETFEKFLDVDALLWWLSSRQYAPEGGIAGRTNKLVDGCYSHWIGGCWPMIQAALLGPSSPEQYDENSAGDLYSAEGLARYILCCCQALSGGLRDKPSMYVSYMLPRTIQLKRYRNPDSYHTCYTLSGISTTEHHHGYQTPQHLGQFASAFSWWAVKKTQHEDSGIAPFEDGTEIEAMHPIYAIPHAAVDEIRTWSLSQPWRPSLDSAS